MRRGSGLPVTDLIRMRDTFEGEIDMGEWISTSRCYRIAVPLAALGGILLIASVAQARTEVLAADQQTLSLTPAEQLAFWTALSQTPKPTPANPRPADAAAHFVPVTILPDPIPATAPVPRPLELILTCGRRIAVAPGFDPQTLRQLIATVEERPCSD